MYLSRSAIVDTSFALFASGQSHRFFFCGMIALYVRPAQIFSKGNLFHETALPKLYQICFLFFWLQYTFISNRKTGFLILGNPEKLILNIFLSTKHVKLQLSVLHNFYLEWFYKEIFSCHDRHFEIMASFWTLSKMLKVE